MGGCFLLVCHAWPFPNSDGQAAVQAEYIDSATLEARLQNVARRMVSTTPRPRPPDSEQATPTPPPQQNGYGGPGQAGANYSSQAPSGQIPSAGGLQGFPGPSGTIAPQDQLLASSSAGLQSSMPQPMGMQQGQPRQYAQHMSMPGQQQGGPGASRMVQAQDSQAMGLLGSTQIKPEAGANGMGMSSNSNYTAMNGPSHPGFIQQQQQAPGTGPVMSNGAPVLLRSSRDWAPGQSPTVLNVSLYSPACPEQSLPHSCEPNAVHFCFWQRNSFCSPALISYFLLQANTMPNMQTGNSRITINGKSSTLSLSPFSAVLTLTLTDTLLAAPLALMTAV